MTFRSSKSENENVFLTHFISPVNPNAMTNPYPDTLSLTTAAFAEQGHFDASSSFHPSRWDHHTAVRQQPGPAAVKPRLQLPGDNNQNRSSFNRTVPVAEITQSNLGSNYAPSPTPETIRFGDLMPSMTNVSAPQWERESTIMDGGRSPGESSTPEYDLHSSDVRHVPAKYPSQVASPSGPRYPFQDRQGANGYTNIQPLSAVGPMDNVIDNIDPTYGVVPGGGAKPAATGPNENDFPILSCAECDTTFSGVWATGNLRRHVKLKHVETPLLSCDVCGKQLQRKDAMLKHRRDRHPELNIPAPVPRKRPGELDRGG